MRNRGFTLVELMIAVAVMAIVVAMAVPSLQSAQQGSQVKQAQSALMSAVTRARSEAVTRGSPVSLCASSNGTHCDGDWSGFVVLLGSPPASTTPIAQIIDQGQLPGVTVDASQTAVVWSSVGSANLPLVANLCADGAPLAQNRAVRVSLLGRAQVSRDVDGDGVHEALDGTALSCS